MIFGHGKEVSRNFCVLISTLIWVHAHVLCFHFHFSFEPVWLPLAEDFSFRFLFVNFNFIREEASERAIRPQYSHHKTFVQLRSNSSALNSTVSANDTTEDPTQLTTATTEDIVLNLSREACRKMTQRSDCLDRIAEFLAQEGPIETRD